jgi:hypothetical protein
MIGHRLDILPKFSQITCQVDITLLILISGETEAYPISSNFLLIAYWLSSCPRCHSWLGIEPTCGRILTLLSPHDLLCSTSVFVAQWSLPLGSCVSGSFLHWYFVLLPLQIWRLDELPSVYPISCSHVGSACTPCLHVHTHTHTHTHTHRYVPCCTISAHESFCCIVGE